MFIHSIQDLNFIFFGYVYKLGNPKYCQTDRYISKTVRNDSSGYTCGSIEKCVGCCYTTKHCKIISLSAFSSRELCIGPKAFRGMQSALREIGWDHSTRAVLQVEMLRTIIPGTVVIIAICSMFQILGMALSDAANRVSNSIDGVFRIGIVSHAWDCRRHTWMLVRIFSLWELHSSGNLLLLRRFALRYKLKFPRFKFNTKSDQVSL